MRTPDIPKVKAAVRHLTIIKEIDSRHRRSLYKDIPPVDAARRKTFKPGAETCPGFDYELFFH